MWDSKEIAVVPVGEGTLGVGLIFLHPEKDGQVEVTLLMALSSSSVRTAMTIGNFDFSISCPFCF